MYECQSIAVVVPCHNEEKLIGRVIETMPAFVDTIVVVDDASQDGTAEVVRQHQKSGEKKVVLIQHEQNQGVGGAIITGYKYARDQRIDVAVVMAGDAQMDPADLPGVLDPIVEGRADYVKGNRLNVERAWQKIPAVRYLGNACLSFTTKLVSGYWHISDSQTGYTAITLEALETLDLDRVFRRYGMPNDILVRLNVENFRVADVPIKPVYNVGEKSGIRLYKVIPSLSWLLTKLLMWRIKEKYIVRDFHPLVFFFTLGVAMMLFSGGLLANMIYAWLVTGPVISKLDVYASLFCMIVGIYSLLFSMWSDKEYNRHLQAKSTRDGGAFGLPRGFWSKEVTANHMDAPTDEREQQKTAA